MRDYDPYEFISFRDDIALRYDHIDNDVADVDDAPDPLAYASFR